MVADSSPVEQLRTALSEVHNAVGAESVISMTEVGLRVKLQGTVQGKNLSYASRVRRGLLRCIEHMRRDHSLHIIVRVELNDAIARLTRAIAAAVELDGRTAILGKEVLVNAAGGVDVQLLLASAHPDSQQVEEAVELLIGQMGGATLGVRVYWDKESDAEQHALAVLRAIRVLQPCSLGQVRDYLLARGDQVPNGTKWLRHRVDRFRQDGVVRVRAEGRIELSATRTVGLMGWTGSGSADIERALYLARREDYG